MTDKAQGTRFKVQGVVGILLVLFLGLVGWMNVTPGYFQEDQRCCQGQGKVVYIKDMDNYCNSGGLYFQCARYNKTVKDVLLLMLAGLDFYK